MSKLVTLLFINDDSKPVNIKSGQTTVEFLN